MSLFRTRRTLKPASMDPARAIPRETVTELLEDAHWAPTHGLTQPWRFHVFATPAARARLGAGLESIYDALTPPAKQDAAKRAKLSAGPQRAPVVIALAAKIDPHGKLPEWEEIAAVACAVENLMLSAHGRGLGAFWSSATAACSPEFIRWLGLDPANHRALGLIYLGWPLPGQPAPQSSRVPLSERVTWLER
jgi:nitroreductase